MSFLKKLFGGGSAAAKGPEFDAVEHDGYFIRPAPMPEGGQYRLHAVISRQMDGEWREYRLIRADMFGSADDAAQFSIRKAKQVIDEQGEALFANAGPRHG